MGSLLQESVPGMNTPMENREYATTKLLDRGFEQHVPKFRYRGYSREDWRRWKTGLQSALRDGIFGLIPDEQRSPPSFEVLETKDYPAFHRHKIVYEVPLGVPIPAYLLVPKRLNDRAPAALCVHGHFSAGKDSVVNPSEDVGVPYGTRLAEMGVVTLCPDNAGMGERDEGGGCGLLWRRLNYLGQDITGHRVNDLFAAMDVLSAVPEVDPTRIGSVGLSGGCWLAMVHAAFDERVRAAALSGYFTTFAQTSWLGHCVCHHPKSIGLVCEMPDIAGLIAPRPICVEWGTDDTSRPVYPAFQMAQQIYEAAGAGTAIELALFDDGHRFDGTRSLPWLVEQLAAAEGK
jgi:dienelactone hydrolase